MLRCRKASQPGFLQSSHRRWEFQEFLTIHVCAQQTIVGKSLSLTLHFVFWDGLSDSPSWPWTPDPLVSTSQGGDHVTPGLTLLVSCVHMWVGTDVGHLLQSPSMVLLETGSLSEAYRFSWTDWPSSPRGPPLSPSTTRFIGTLGFSNVEFWGLNSGLSVCWVGYRYALWELFKCGVLGAGFRSECLLGNTSLTETFIFLASLLILDFWPQMTYFL